MKNAVGREIPEHIAGCKYNPYRGPWACIPSRQANGGKSVDAPAAEKVLKSIDAAIEAVGLRDGMTISFHHHLRNGDYVMKLVVDAIARKGIRGLRLTASSLSAVQDAIMPHLEAGVITAIDTSGIRGEIGKFVSAGKLPHPVMIRTHGGRARAIESGELSIDVAFIGAPACDIQGNINGVDGPAACGSLGYAMVDAAYADKVVAITDHLMPHPLQRISIPQTQVDFIVKVDSIGDPKGISTGSLRISTDPKELLISQYAATVIEHSGCFRDNFSLQLGSGGASLTAAKFIKEKMKTKGITAAFGVGGITGIFAEMMEEGLVNLLFDAQSFDSTAIQSLRQNDRHLEVSASYYASPGTCGPIVNNVDAVILSATEVDIHFNVNVLTGSNGRLMGAPGGHPDTAAGSNLCIVALPLVRRNFPVMRESVHTIVTPGETVDVIVTDRGVAINPLRQDLIHNLQGSGLPIMLIEDLQRLAYEITGTPTPAPTGGDIVGLVEYRDGTIIDVIRKIG
ncbi:citrate lyase subunit alpha [Acetonema longum]|uniref:Citrate lyase alpha chain n=1 Tax=Acetonema longum DSM 6540 TaxID=1009370 RepID=F7NLQ0_9FIRM|nr:citrate lyase subunit alpha [Acetonema longum]EGO62991.1 citrate lyase subunit alpha [Acetonema longum DSM 6540]